MIRFRSDLAAEAIKTLAFQIKNKLSEDKQTESLMLVVGSVHQGKPSLTVLLSDDLVAKGYSAVNITREAAKIIQGGGGGQAHFATAGGKNPEALDAAMEAIKL